MSVGVLIETIISGKVAQAFKEKYDITSIVGLNSRMVGIKRKIEATGSHYLKWYRELYGDLYHVKQWKDHLRLTGTREDKGLPKTRKPNIDQRFTVLFNKYLEECADKEEFNKFREDFTDLISQKHTKESLMIMIGKETSENLVKPIHRAFAYSFWIKTGEFHHLTEPPMGMKEFVNKTIEEDIFDVGEIEDAETN